ncbi:MAG: O-antigen ligase family protein [Oscillospiraceae bacterium]|nr:O-antigen ligase family protein [Oscillospiraceae bacterium]
MYANNIITQLLNKLLDFSLFRIVYTVTLIFEMIVILDVFALYVRCAVMAWGLIIIIYNMFKEPCNLEIEHRKLALIFIFCCILTSIIHMSLEFLANLAVILHIAICFFLFFGIHKNTDRKTISKEMKFIFNFFVIFSVSASILGFILISVKPELKIFHYKLGIIKNRFAGLYTNSNLVAFSAVVSLVSLETLDFKKILKISFSIINILTLFLSDSNASVVFLIVYFTAKILLLNTVKYSSLKNIKLIRELFFLIVCVLVMISSSFFLRNSLQEFVASCMSRNMNKNISSNYTESIQNQDIVPGVISNEKVKIGRSNYDISSGRMTLLKQGIKLFKIHPFLGIGRENLWKYSQIYIEGGLIFSDLHNSYLTILVSYGVIGFVIFMYFCISVLSKIFRTIIAIRHKPNFAKLTNLFSILTAYFTYSLFEKAIISEVTFMSIYMWIILGFAYSSTRLLLNDQVLPMKAT